MLYAFDFKFSRLPEGAIDSVVEKIDVLVRDDVASMLTFQMIVLDLAADRVNPGRMMMVHFFSESVKEHLVKKDIDHVRMVCLVFAHLRLQTNEKVTIQKEIL